MTATRAVTLLVLIAIILLWWLVEGAQGTTSANAGAPMRVPEAERYWESRIHEIGGKSAYTVFAESVATATPQSQHESVHAFGAALYTVEGIAGLPVCDDRFSFGCFHEFLGRAIADRGLESVSALDEGCFSVLTTSQLSCSHGIGHGILAYLGYEHADLERALATCRGLPHFDPIGGCYGGVFMEYNFQTMLGRDGITRAVLEGDVLYPCNQLSDEYTDACAYWQPQWWNQVLKQDLAESEARFARIGALCSSLGKEGRVRMCFEGVGNIIGPVVDFDGRRAAQLCEHSSGDSRYQLFCKSTVANSLFLGGSGKKGDAHAVRAGLTGLYLDYCSAYSMNATERITREMRSAI